MTALGQKQASLPVRSPSVLTQRPDIVRHVR
jgi:hypothetical protein